MRNLNDLLDITDPAITDLRELVAGSLANAMLPRDVQLAEQTLLRLQVSTHAMLGAVAYETGGLTAFEGRIRILGAGQSRSLLACNEAVGGLQTDAKRGGFVLVADDVLGGLFALNAGRFGAAGQGNVFWLPPDGLDWCDMEVGYSRFIGWCMTGDFGAVYGDITAPAAVRALQATPPAFDETLNFYPFLWTQEGLVDASVRAVPAIEAMCMRMDLLG